MGLLLGESHGFSCLHSGDPQGRLLLHISWPNFGQAHAPRSSPERCGSLCPLDTTPTPREVGVFAPFRAATAVLSFASAPAFRLHPHSSSPLPLFGGLRTCADGPVGCPPFCGRVGTVGSIAVRISLAGEILGLLKARHLLSELWARSRRRRDNVLPFR